MIKLLVAVLIAASAVGACSSAKPEPAKYPTMADWYRQAHERPGIPPSELDRMAAFERLAQETRKMTDGQLRVAIVVLKQSGDPAAADVAALLEEILDERIEQERHQRED